MHPEVGPRSVEFSLSFANLQEGARILPDPTSQGRNGCLCKLGSFLVGVLTTRALLTIWGPKLGPLIVGNSHIAPQGSSLA